MTVRFGVHPEELRTGIRQLAQGRSNAVGTFTCTTSSATTTVSDTTIQIGDVLICTPTTANAATELASGNFYITIATQSGQITVNHTNSATTGRTFAYEVKEA